MNSMTLEAEHPEHQSGTPEPRFVTVCEYDDLIENVGQCALVAGRQVALFRISGSDRVYALSNYDPFSEANVLSRGVVGDLQGRIVVASPIYKQHFDLTTGECLEDANVKVDVFAVQIDAGQVSVAIPGEPR